MGTGALSFDDLFELWKSVVPNAYSRPLIENPDSGREVIDQAVEQFLRVSLAIETSTQAMYCFPWSGQTGDPAGGGSRAKTTLLVSRTGRADRAVVLPAGLVVAHETEDYGETGAVVVTTGRRYLATAPAILLPGETGPVELAVESERIGYGYNAPLPGTIRKIVQPTASVSNGGGVMLAGNRLRVSSGSGETISPLHVGQYVELLSGAGAGQIRQIVTYEASSPVVIGLDSRAVLRGGLALEMLLGEPVTQGAATGTLLGVSNSAIVIESTSSVAFDSSTPILGLTSGGSFLPSRLDVPAAIPLGSSSWRLCDWDLDLLLDVTNESSPTGGRAAFLDELGDSRKVYRSPGESDSAYRQRVGNPADVVSPNAIRRAANSVVSPFGDSVCLREVGTLAFPGFFFDAGSSADDPQVPAANFAWDVEPDGPDRFKVFVDIAISRGYFLLGVPRYSVGDFGFAFDATTIGLTNGYDVVGTNFFDGYPIGIGNIYAAIYAAADRARAGGVGFDLYLEDIGCP